MKRIIFFILIIVPIILNAQQNIYDEWDKLLSNYVSTNKRSDIIFKSVDYIQLSTDERFDEILNQLTKFDLEVLSEKNDEIAFWINVYNIAAIKVVIDNNIPSSIKDAGNLLKQVWKKEAINIGGNIYSLGEIEHEILRKMNQPLIHFGIVCASLSCPDLILESYRPQTVIEQLKERARNFLQNETKGMKLNGTKKVVELSAIFKWFKDDFKNGVPQFVKQYSGVDISDYKIRYMDYNWKLNTK